MAHSRLTSSAVVRKLAVLMEVAERWPDTTTSCRAELSAHTAALAARATVTSMLVSEHRCYVCDVDEEGAFIAIRSQTMEDAQQVSHPQWSAARVGRTRIWAARQRASLQR